MLIFTKSFTRPLGSGSACRSVKGQVVVWGNQANIKGSSDLYGVEFLQFTKFQELPRYHLISRQGENKFQVL
jgi:mevalonate pyrophosphate decarboxylase